MSHSPWNARTKDYIVIGNLVSTSIWIWTVSNPNCCNRIELFALTGSGNTKVSLSHPLAPKGHLVKLSQHLIIDLTRNYIKGFCSLPDIDPSALDTGFISKQEFKISLRRVLFQKPNELGEGVKLLIVVGRVLDRR